MTKEKNLKKRAAIALGRTLWIGRSATSYPEIDCLAVYLAVRVLGADRFLKYTGMAPSVLYTILERAVALAKEEEYP
jgi:hypothetical protein